MNRWISVHIAGQGERGGGGTEDLVRDPLENRARRPPHDKANGSVPTTFDVSDVADGSPVE